MSTLVEKGPFVLAFCPGPVWSRDKRPGHVAPNPTVPFVPVLYGLLSRFVAETGTKGLPAGRGPFCPGFSHEPEQKVPKDRDIWSRWFPGDVA